MDAPCEQSRLVIVHFDNMNEHFHGKNSLDQNKTRGFSCLSMKQTKFVLVIRF